MNVTAGLVAALLFLSLSATMRASTFGSVEPIATPDVIDTSALSAQPLRVREAFAARLLQCGIVSRVVDVLTSTGAVKTINELNTHVSVGAGGFAGRTNPSFVFTVMDDGPNAASRDDIKVLTDSLGYVMSQASAFLLDADDAGSFDFPANYVVLNFETPPPIGAIGSALPDRGPNRPRVVRDRYQRLHAVRPRISFAPIRRVRRAVHRRLRPRGEAVWSGVHACRQRRAVAVRGRRGISRQRLDVEPARGRVPVAHSAREPSGAQSPARVPSARHRGGSPQPGAPRRAVTRRRDGV